MKKNILFLLSPIVLTPLFLISCSKNTNPSLEEKIIISFQKSDKYFVNEENIISALINKPNKNYYFDWNFSSGDISIEENGKEEIKFRSNREISNSRLELVIYETSSKTKELARSTTDISIYNKETGTLPSYSVSINKTNNVISQKETTFDINFVSSNESPIPSNLFYKWSVSPQENVEIKNNGKQDAIFKFKYKNNYTVSLIVFENDENGKKLCETSINVDVGSNPNIKYNLNIDGVDYYTGKQFSNDVADFERIKLEANEFVQNSINQKDVQNYMDTFANNYANSFKTQRNNTLTFNILENNINLNQDKTISGNIKIEFNFNAEFAPSLNSASRNAGDKEIHNFVFENSLIEPYINTTISNFLSYKIKTKYLQKQIITTRQYLENTNVGLKDQYVYLDMIDELTLQLNNSIFSIIPEKFVENTYLYNTISSSDEQLAFKEIIKQILSSKAKIIFGGKHPAKPILISNPILEIELTKNYVLSDVFKNNLTWVLGSLFNFVSTKSTIIQQNNFIYIDSGPVNTYYDNSEKPNSIVDLSAGVETPYNKRYFELLSFNLYPEEMKIKEKIIEYNKSKVTSSWFEYLNSLSDEEKAKNIYTSFLNIVSYGQLGSFASSIGGLLNNKVLCEGYANLFSYMANIYQISSITITGHVKENADETGAGGLHAWNLIKVDNEWLWCDPTWDDGMSAGSTQIKYDNFLKPTNEFFTATSHVDVTNWNSGKSLPISIPTFS